MSSAFTPADLLRLVGQACQQEDAALQQAAWDQLHPWLMTQIELIAARSPASVRDELRAEGPSWIFERLCCNFDPNGGNFAAWVHRVLQNRARDLLRAQKRRSPMSTGNSDPDQIPDIPKGKDLQASQEVVEHQIRELRRQLDHLRWERGLQAEYDYYALFLLDLRCRVTTRLQRAFEGSQAETLFFAQLPEIAAWVIPWHDQEQQLRIQHDWPALGPLWAFLAERISQLPHACSGEQLLPLLNQQLPNTRQLTLGNWRKLLQRAHKRARQEATPETWSTYFAALFPRC